MYEVETNRWHFSQKEADFILFISSLPHRVCFTAMVHSLCSLCVCMLLSASPLSSHDSKVVHKSWFLTDNSLFLVVPIEVVLVLILQFPISYIPR